MSELTPPVPEMGRHEAASSMRRIELRGGGGDQVVTVDGAPTGMSFEMRSDPGITFPAVWLDGQRVYAVEVWSEEGLVLSVPPQSEDVDWAFDEHERVRSGG
jgi:hypothetical protein